MTSARFIHSPEFQLSNNNYSQWIFRIKNELNASDHLEYTEQDIVAEIADEVRRRTKDEKDFKKTKMHDQIALSIIITNVIPEVIKKIQRTEKIYEAMEINNKDYNKEKSKDVDYYLRKLNTIITKSIDKCLDTMRELKIIANILNEKRYKYSDLTKMNIIYYVAPTESKIENKFKQNNETRWDDELNWTTNKQTTTYS